MSDEFSGQMTNIGCGARPGPHVLGQPHRLADVVVEHRAALGVELQPEPRHVALHRGDVDGRVVAGARTGMPDVRATSAAVGEQHDGDAGTGQHDRGRCGVGRHGCAATT